MCGGPSQRRLNTSEPKLSKLSPCFQGPSPRMPIDICWITTSVFLQWETLKCLALRNIHHGWQQCFPILGISGYASTGDQLDSTK